MQVKIMFFAHNPETYFKRMADFLSRSGVIVCGFMSFTDDYKLLSQLHEPDIICYHAGTIKIGLYANNFNCKLLAVTDFFNEEDRDDARRLGARHTETGLQIAGYVQKNNDYLLRAINLVYVGRESFYAADEMPPL